MKELQEVTRVIGQLGEPLIIPNDMEALNL
jgi:hypothetical protein